MTPAPRGISATRSLRGQTAYKDGLAAEDAVASRYAATGHIEAGRRWRGEGGEIDLIFERGGEVVFVEVKKARSIDRAAARLSLRQLGRIVAAGEAWLATRPLGLATPARVDLALVGAPGEMEIIENVTLD